jgi:hypothetical protein
VDARCDDTGDQVLEYWGPPEPVDVGAYYVVSEMLANAAKRQSG